MTLKIAGLVFLFASSSSTYALSTASWEKLEAQSANSSGASAMRQSYLQGISDTLNVMQNSEGQIQLNEAVTVLGGGGVRRRICLPTPEFLFNASHVEAAIKSSLSSAATVGMYQATYGSNWKDRTVSKLAIDGIYKMFPCKD